MKKFYNMLEVVISALIHLIAFPIVGIFYAAKLINGRRAGKIAYAIIGLLIFSMIVALLAKFGINIIH